MRIHKILPSEFPESWASDWGEDEYGLWMAFTYKGIRQNFRWIEPSTFLMGSPESELERYDRETQYEVVTLTKGFWLADTTVTQSLWEAMMGKNPSNFPSPDCPVENISWDDAQAFISRMNEMKPELKLCLPLETQWEYACRAGTTSPFYFGSYITSEIANFDGSNPYNGGEKSEFRQRTVKVKSFLPNAWGLYEMHGNVWEWCQDRYSRYSLSIRGEDSSFVRRVLRGGSWRSNGGNCRSAYRSPIIQTHCHGTYGFRLARNCHIESTFLMLGKHRKVMQSNIIAELRQGSEYRLRVLRTYLDNQIRLQIIEECDNHVVVQDNLSNQNKRNSFFANRLVELQQQMDVLAEKFNHGVELRLQKLDSYQSSHLQRREQERLESSIDDFMDTIDASIEDFKNRLS